MYNLSLAAYIFTHQYLNTIQQGIQSAHVVAELFAQHKISGNEDHLEKVYEWACDHKTIRILNAGAGVAFDDRYTRFIEIVSEYNFNLPAVCFSEPDINNLVTAFGFIMTVEAIERIETEQRDMERLEIDPETHPVIEFLKEMNSAR